MSYVFYNPNPKGKTNVGDCSVRAVSKATGTTWNVAFWGLVETANELCDMPSSKKTIEAYLKKEGFEWNGFKVKRGEKRMTVDEFCDVYTHGVYVLRLSGHVVTVIDGAFYDTWDCGASPLYGYWSKQA